MKSTFIFILLLASLACTRHEKTTVEDRFQKIQAQIDRKNYQEAEEQLNAILKEEPENEKARVILASVFVHKAGITVKDYFTLEKLTYFESDEERGKRPPLVNPGSFEKLEIKEDSELAKVLDFVKQLNEGAARAQEIVEKFNQVPELTDEKAENVYLALQELEKLKVLETGNALYRGIIKLLYFKYLWNHQRFFSFGQEKFCSQSILQLNQQLDTFQSFSGGMIRDLGNGFPKNKAQFDQAAEDLNKNFILAQKWMGQLKEQKQNLQQIVEALAPGQSVPGFSCDF